MLFARSRIKAMLETDISKRSGEPRRPNTFGRTTRLAGLLHHQIQHSPLRIGQRSCELCSLVTVAYQRMSVQA
jgi:hypothetical protein